MYCDVAIGRQLADFKPYRARGGRYSAEVVFDPNHIKPCAADNKEKMNVTLGGCVKTKQLSVRIAVDFSIQGNITCFEVFTLRKLDFLNVMLVQYSNSSRFF